ncbi:ShlB/FhaC/HecB family hemolysin secretion/activation protein [Deferribacterales bacterium RsTz2092]|nr:peptide transporter [Deferribacterales bacterium]
MRASLLVIIVAIFMFSLLAVVPVYSQMPDPAEQERIRKEQEQIQRDQQRQIYESLRNRELKDALKKPASSPIKPDEGIIPEDSGECVQVNEVRYVGNIIDNKFDKQIKVITGKYINRCLTIGDINALLKEITDVYMSAGYVTSRAFMTTPQPSLKEGILTVNIVEGSVSEIEGLTAGKAFTAFPFMKGKPLNLRDIEQGLDQLNRLMSNGAKLDIKPAEGEDNASVVMISNDKIGASRIEHFFDNAGSEYTGLWRTGLKYTQDNILGINDQWNFSYIKPMNESYLYKDANAIATGLSVPLGYWLFSNNFAYSDSLNSFPLSISQTLAKSEGRNFNDSFAASRSVLRGQKHKVSLGLTLTYKKSESYLEILDTRTKNNATSRTITTIEANAPIVFYMDGGTLYVKPSYVRGVRWLGALDDRDSPYSQRAQYDAYKLYGYFAHRLPIGIVILSVDGQLSNDELYSSESVFIGGEYSVRGFKKDGAQGDSGGYTQINYELKLEDVSSKGFLKPFTISIFFDYGHVVSNDKHTFASNLSGAGGKLGFKYGYLESSITYASAIRKTKEIRDKDAIYAYTSFVYAF